MAAIKVADLFIDVKMNTSRIASDVNKVNKSMRGMAGSIGKSVAKARKPLFDFKTFVGQIAHYISFSIGVQMVMGIRRGLESAVDAFSKFEKAAASAASVAGYVGAAFEEAVESLMDFSRELSRKSIYSVIEISNAMYDLASAGYDVVNMSDEEFIPIINYATATQSDLKEATYAVVVAIKQFGMELSDSVTIVDTWTALITNSFATMEKLKDGMRYTGQIAGTLGQDFTGLNSALAVLMDVGYEGGQAGQRLNMIFTKLLSPTDKARRALAAMGVSIESINPATHDLIDILYTLRDANFDAADATKMFRARTAAAATALVTSVDKVAEYNRIIMESTGVTETLAEKQRATLWASMKEFTNALTEFGTDIAKDLKPALIDIMNVIRNQLLPALKAIGPAIKVIVGTYVSYIVATKLIIALQTVYVGILKKLAIATLSYGSVTKGLTVALTQLGIQATLGFSTFLLFSNILDETASLSKKLGPLFMAAGAAVLLFASKVQLASVKIQVALGPIGWVTLAIGALVTVIGEFTGKADEAAEKAKQMQEAIEQLTEVNEDGVSMLDEMTTSINDLNRALTKEIELRRELNDLTEDGLTTSDRYMEVQSLLVTYENDRENALNSLVSTTGNVISTLRDVTNTVDTGIQSWALWNQATKENNDRIESQGQLEDEHTNILKELIAAKDIYGESSKEVGDILLRQESIESELQELEGKKEGIIDRQVKAYSKYRKAYRDASESEKELINLGVEAYKLRSEALIALDDYDKYFNKHSRLLDIQANKNKYLAEALLNVYEIQDKLYDIELKRYKLTQERQTQLEEMFDILAQEGELNQEIIDAYVAQQQAQGDVAMTGAAFFSMLGGLTQDQRDLVTDWVQAYVDSGGDITMANAAIGGSLEEVVGISSSSVSAALAYANALVIQQNAVDTLHDVMIPYMNDLQENNLLSIAGAEALTEYNKSLNDTGEIAQETQKNLAALKTAMMGLVDLTAQIWAAEDMPIMEFPDYDIEWGTLDPGEPLEEFEEESQKAGAGANAFSQSVLRLNQQTGYFADKSADAYTVMRGYIAFMASAGVTGTDAFSASALLAAKILGDEMAVSGDTATTTLDNLGVSMGELMSMSGIALPAVGSGISTTEGLLNDAETTLDSIITKLGTLTAKTWDITVNVNYVEDTRHGGAWGGDLFDPMGFLVAAGEWFGGLFSAKGGIKGLQHGIKETMGPQMSIIGEAGPEAVVPLAGSNRKYGEEILRYILPKYFPDIMNFQTGGMVSTGGTTTNSYATDNYNITGPITVVSNSPSNFMEQMKYQYRSSKRR